MTRSSRSRRLRAKAKKRMVKAGTALSHSTNSTQDATLPTLSKTDKLYMIGFAVLSFIVTAFYWYLGGRNLFVFPALFCLSVGARKYWSGPMRRFADDAQ